jgi:TBCC domain-containing protein 1
MSSGSNLVFCVSPVLFESSGLLLEGPLPAQWMQRLRQDCPTSTTISQSDWMGIAVSTLGIREPVATAIFDVFSALSFLKPEQRQESNRVLLGKMGGVVDEAKWPLVAASRLVSLPGLVMFLMAQQLLERSQPRVPAGEPNHEAVQAFVKSQLHDILNILAVSKQGRLSVQDCQDLQLLLREFANGVEQPFGTSIGFLWPRTEKTVDVATPLQFIRPRLVLPTDVRPPHTASSSIQQQPFSNNITLRGLSSTVQIIHSTTTLMACNHSASHPLQQASHLNPAVMKLPSSSFRVTRCLQTNVFATSELPNTVISQLANCAVTLGPVSGVMTVDKCENCQISCLCSALVVSSCRNVTIYVCTSNPPVLVGTDLEGVRIAPYNTHYSTLEEHLLSTGINPKLNLWRCGISPSAILSPSDFSPVSFPIAPQTVAVVTTRTNPVPLPPEYTNAVQLKVQRFAKLTASLQTAYRQLEANGRRDLAEALRSKLHAMFLDWLYDSGQAKGLLDLLHQAPPAAGSGAAAVGR